MFEMLSVHCSTLCVHAYTSHTRLCKQPISTTECIEVAYYKNVFT